MQPSEATFDVWGFIPSFLYEDDPRSVREQFNERYVSGWSPFKGFTYDPETFTLTYPEDPPLEAISTMTFRDETIHIYPHAWVAVVQKDGTYEVCRMD